MNMFQIFALIMAVFMIAMCAIYARTKRTGYNNLFSMFMLSVGVVTLGILAVIYPSWWMVSIMAYALFGLWYYCTSDYKKNKRYVSREFATSKTRKKLRKSSEWLCCILLLATSLIVLIEYWTWYIGVAFIPLGAVSALITLSNLKDVLDEIWVRLICKTNLEACILTSAP